VRALLAASLLGLILAVAYAAPSDDTPKAAATRKLLKEKVTFTWKDVAFGDVLEEMKEKVKGLHVRVDTQSGVNLNKQISYSCKDVPLEKALAELLGKYSWGYYVMSKRADGYDGVLHVRAGSERGYPAGEEPAEEKPKGDKDKPKDKPREKPKAEDKPREKPKVEDKPVENDPEKDETDAARKLKFIKELIDDGKVEKAKDRLDELIKRYPKTKAAAQAKELLKDLEK
jgi:hypothetical protein